jgi:hypothetical protein
MMLDQYIQEEMNMRYETPCLSDKGRFLRTVRTIDRATHDTALRIQYGVVTFLAGARSLCSVSINYNSVQLRKTSASLQCFSDWFPRVHSNVLNYRTDTK